MTAEARNDGFHMLDDFVCQAIPGPAVARPGSNAPVPSAGAAGVGNVTIDFGHASPPVVTSPPPAAPADRP